jgi:hypothetical protein
LFGPKSLAGIFGAAPSIALVTLALISSHEARAYAAIDSIGVMAFAFCTRRFLPKESIPLCWIGSLSRF